MVRQAAISRLAALGLMAAALAGAFPGAAQDVASLYEASVTVTAGEQAAFKAGMGDVLVKVTGRRDAASLPALAALVDGASRFVTSYRRVAGGRLSITYDGDAIERAVAAAGLPFWGEQRPLTLVWLAVDRGGGQRGLVTAEAASGERRAVEAVAGQRGLPLAWPSAAGGEDARLRFDQAWSGDSGSLVSAASGYGADGVLIGRARAAGNSYTVDWTFVGAGGRSEVRGDLGEGIHLAADRFASLYASSEAVRRSDIDVTITGVTTAAQYAEVSRQLAALAVVREVSLRHVLADSVVFRVSTRGGLAALQREAVGGGHLRPVASDQGAAVFAYQP